MPNPPPPRPRLQSHDDLTQVSALEQAEERARAALRLVEQAKQEKAELTRQLEQAKAAEVQRQLDAVARAAQVPTKVELAPESKPSQRPGVLTVQAKGLKVGIPLALLIPLITGLWAGIQYFNDYQRQFKAMQLAVASKDERLTAVEKLNSEQSQELAQLRETAAALSGYLTGVLPKAGVNVPGTGSFIQSDPLPLGARRQTPVNVRTPVPTPPPR